MRDKIIVTCPNCKRDTLIIGPYGYAFCSCGYEAYPKDSDLQDIKKFLIFTLFFLPLYFLSLCVFGLIISFVFMDISQFEIIIKFWVSWKESGFIAILFRTFSIIFSLAGSFSISEIIIDKKF